MGNDSLMISVIIPVYNGEAYLAEAVESVRQQNYPPSEIIIVDDGSTDGTADVAASLGKGIQFVFQPNGGPAAAYNTGIRMASGSILGFLDGDDLWTAGKLNAQLQYLSSHPSVEIVQGAGRYYRPSLQDTSGTVFQEAAETFVSFTVGTGLFRRSVFDKIGLFDESLRYSEDMDWFMRAREQGVSIAVLDQVTMLYRIHSDNMTGGRTVHELNCIPVLKRSLDRRRRENGGQAQSLSALPHLHEPAKIF